MGTLRTIQADFVKGIETEKNYISNSTFENFSTSGWQKFTTSIVSGLPSGTPTLDVAASLDFFNAVTSNPLSGIYSLRVGPTGIPWAAGEGFISNAFTIDRQDLAKPLTFSFSYEAISNPTAANFSGILGSQTFAVYLYDETAGAWVQPSGFLGMNQNYGVGVLTGSFQTSNVVGQQYRLAVLALQASTGDINLSFDNFKLGSESIVLGCPVTDWQSYDLTIGAVTTPPTPGAGYTQASRWRRVGDTLEISYRFSQTAAGSGGSGTYLFPLPPGLVIDTSKIAVTTTPNGQSGTIVGSATIGTTTTNNAQYSTVGVVFAYNSTNLMMAAGSSASTVNALYATGSGSYSIGTTPIYYSFTARVPIAGWSSNVQFSNDTDTRVVAARYTSTSGSTGSRIQFNTKDFDTHAAVTTGASWVYTAPVSGIYEVRAYVNVGANNIGTNQLTLYKDGVLNQVISGFGGSIANNTVDGSCLISLNAGNAIHVQIGGAPVTISNAWIAIDRLSGPSVIAASETVAAKYNVLANGTTNSTTPINFAGKIYDTHNAVTTGSAWKFTAPISGFYSVKFNFNNNGSPAASTVFCIFKGGVALEGRQYVSAAAGATLYYNVTSTIKLNAGEYIDIRTTNAYPYIGGSYGTTSGNYPCLIEIEKVGN